MEVVGWINTPTPTCPPQALHGMDCSRSASFVMFCATRGYVDDFNRKTNPPPWRKWQGNYQQTADQCCIDCPLLSPPPRTLLYLHRKPGQAAAESGSWYLWLDCWPWPALLYQINLLPSAERALGSFMVTCMTIHSTSLLMLTNVCWNFFFFTQSIFVFLWWLGNSDYW